MNISGVSFKGTYSIPCKTIEEAKRLAGSISGISSGLGVVMSEGSRKVHVTDLSGENSGKILECLKEKPGVQQAKTQAALEAYRKVVKQVPRTVDACR